MNTKYVIHIKTHRPIGYFKCVQKGLVRSVRRPEAAKAFETREQAEKYASILFGLTMTIATIDEITR